MGFRRSGRMISLSERERERGIGKSVETLVWMGLGARGEWRVIRVHECRDRSSNFQNEYSTEFILYLNID